MIKKVVAAFGVSLLAVSIQTTSILATTIEVPSDISSIQLAINSAVDGDTILVAPGRYYENIIFHGKKVVLTSWYSLSGDPQDILRTIIDGSQYTYLDSASTVAMYDNEDSTTALIGFVITGGNGCIVFGAREGGGINLDHASPLIKNNIIAGNRATIPAGGNLRGGGGVNFRFSTGLLIGNYILSNQGYNYCGGLLIQDASVVAKNNVIAYNDGGDLTGTWDGAGAVYTYKCFPPSKFYSNTIAFNHAARAGGFYANVNGNSILINNILYGNDNGQITLSNTNPANFPVLYSDIEGGFSGTANVDMNPILNPDMTLDPISPIVDLGDPDVFFNDVEDITNLGSAQYPALGTIRNDMGSFGGSEPIFQIPLPTLSDPIVSFEGSSSTFIDDSAFVSHMITTIVTNAGLNLTYIDSIVNTSSLSTVGSPSLQEVRILDQDTLSIIWTPTQRFPIIDTVMIYHNDVTYGSPFSYIVDYSIAPCCATPGDYDHNGAFNIADVTSGIARIFSGGPVSPCQDESDADGNNSFNVADVTYGIARIFGGGPAPTCGTTGI